jgi:hypothetical protein
MSDKKAPRVVVLTLEGEKRQPIKGDLFIGEGVESGAFCLSTYAFPNYRFCYTRHDIDVPDEATGLVIIPTARGGVVGATEINVPLPPVLDPLVEKIAVKIAASMDQEKAAERWSQINNLAHEIAALVREGGVK